MMKKIMLVSLMLLGTVFLAVYGYQRVVRTRPITSIPVVKQLTNNNLVPTEAKIVSDKSALETAAYDAVNAKTNGVWDKKIEIDSIDESQKAVKGSWWANDRWDWIAWQANDGEWVVLVSADGFDCTQVDAIPIQYVNFFEDVIYRFGKKYCY